MWRFGCAAAAALGLLAGPAAAQVDPGRLSAHVKALASDEFEGRGPATRGEERTLAYLIAQFKAAGAAPGGPGGGWLQPVKMNRFVMEGTPAVRLSGDKAACVGDLSKSVVAWSRRPGGATDVRDAPLVFAGFGVEAPDQGWHDYEGADMRGKVAVVLLNDPDYRSDQGPFGGRNMTWYGRWFYKAEELARRGAAGVLLVFEPDTTGLTWPLLEAVYRQPLLDIEHASAERLQFEAWIDGEAARKLLSCAALDLETERKAAETPGFRARPIEGLRLSTRFAYRTESRLTHNVLAMVRGAKRPKESFFYTAHWDHMGIAAPDVTGDKIYNGALDNAGGVASLLELARLFAAGPRPERSVVFMATTLEEQGLLGAEYYAAHPVHPLATTAGGINMDAVNLFGPVPNMTVTGLGRTDLEQRLEVELKAAGRRMDPNELDAIGFYFRSDHFPFVKRGVPFLFAGSGWDIADRLANTRDPSVGTRFHQPSDEWGPDLDFKAAAADVDIYYRVGLKLANSGAWPGWKPGAEFRALRAETASQRR